jgi:THO complex subunit 4
VYSRRTDAVAAVKRYNNVQLDGKPMKIEIIGTNVSAPATGAAPAKTAGFSGAPRRCVVYFLQSHVHYAIYTLR